MAAKAQSLSPAGGPPKRRLRNYLLHPRFQLKYTGMVVAVTVVVASVLGYFAYHYSQGMTQSLSISLAGTDPSVGADIMGYANREDRKVLTGIVAGIGILALVLGVTGIIITHKLVGPAYKMKRLLGEVASGKLRLSGALRKGDELQDVFRALEHMVDALRVSQQQEISQLDVAIESARQDGASEDTIGRFIALRDRMQAALGDDRPDSHAPPGER